MYHEKEVNKVKLVVNDLVDDIKQSKMEIVDISNQLGLDGEVVGVSNQVVGVSNQVVGVSNQVGLDGEVDKENIATTNSTSSSGSKSSSSSSSKSSSNTSSSGSSR